MREVLPEVWIGNSRDAGDLKQIAALGIQVIVDLAADEPLIPVPRDMAYFRCPLVDGEEADDWKTDLAIQTVGLMLVAGVPLLVACSAGMSRSPAIVAAALALSDEESLESALRRVTASGPCDISPALWAAIEDRFAEED
jgi:protein-tyrosine phosphatase